MKENEEVEESEKRSSGIFLSCFFIFLLFFPLITAYFEYKVTKTNYTDRICKKLGVINFLRGLYRPIVRLLK